MESVVPKARPTVATTARVLEDPASPYSVEERPTLRVLKSSQMSWSIRPLSGSTRPAEWLADASALRFIKKGSGIVSCWPFHQQTRSLCARIVWSGITAWQLAEEHRLALERQAEEHHRDHGCPGRCTAATRAHPRGLRSCVHPTTKALLAGRAAALINHPANSD